jgi:2-C-methyl-D-erythritol 4-phosphate cytidylyltransferase
VRYGLVVPAAGSGRRLGASIPKQYQEIAGRSLLEHSLRPFLADVECTQICVAVAADDLRWPELRARLGNSRLVSVWGGAERAHSVRAGLAALEHHLQPNDWVLVHDAARPCVTRTEIDALKAALAEHPIGGLLAVPLADTLKRAHGAADAVAETVSREGLWRALTPQMFRYQALCKALDAAVAAGRTPTDEAQAVEWSGLQPLLVRGSTLNIKVTTPADMQLAAALLAGRAAS